MLRIFYLIITIIRILKYLISSKKRYSNLLLNILIHKPKSILEVGVYNGNRAIEMIQATKIFNNTIKYYGFDLFEDFKKNILKTEYSKIPNNLKSIEKKLSCHAKIKLYKGFTEKTLPKFVKKKFKIDLIFIDGGHAIKTIKNDWKFCSQLMNKKSIVIFDDYYLDDKKIILKFGSNKTFQKIKSKKYNKTFLPFVDEFNKKHYRQKIKMFKVRLK